MIHESYDAYESYNESCNSYASYDSWCIRLISVVWLLCIMRLQSVIGIRCIIWITSHMTHMKHMFHMHWWLIWCSWLIYASFDHMHCVTHMMHVSHMMQDSQKDNFFTWAGKNCVTSSHTIWKNFYGENNCKWLIAPCGATSDKQAWDLFVLCGVRVDNALAKLNQNNLFAASVLVVFFLIIFMIIGCKCVWNTYEIYKLLL